MPQISPRARKLRITAFVVAIVLFLGVGIAMLWSAARTVTSYDWIEHTYGTISAIQEVRASLHHAESAARGYRLTGQPSQREEFLAVVPQVHYNVIDLAALLADNPVQSQRVARLRKLTEQRLALSHQLVAATPRLAADAVAQDTMGRGFAVTTQVNDLTLQMLQTEQALLRERRARGVRDTRLLIGFSIIGTSLALLLLAMLLRSLLQENRRSRQLGREARAAVIDLQASNAALHHLSEQRGALSRYAGLLQSCQDVDEALKVTASLVAELLPDAGGRCYLLRASQDLAENAASFGTPAVASAELLQPQACWALRRSQRYVVEHLSLGVACSHVDTSNATADTWSICVPLIAQGTPLGLLHVNGKGAGGALAAEAALDTVAEQLSLALINLQLRDTLRMQSLRDPMTGLFNRRYLEESVPREIERCQRRNMSLAVLMLDVDQFKLFNDTHGHAAGDALLTGVGQTLLGMTRKEDLACRYGGEEFTVMLGEIDEAGALQRAEEIRLALASTTVQHLRQTLGPCTASIGVAMMPRDGESLDVLLESADAALYRAKAGGRNQVVSASTAPA